LPREAEALVDHHVERHRRREQDHPDERQDVAHVHAEDLAAAPGHGSGWVVSAGPVSAWRFGGFCVMQGTFGLNGGRPLADFRGREPRILFSVRPTSGSISPGTWPVVKVWS